MEYSVLGKTGRMVSKIGFGGATAGSKNYLEPFDGEKKEDRKMLLEAIQNAYELGINYFDTAAGYGNGQSEEIFGEGLQEIDPCSIFLATKVSKGDKYQVRKSVESSLNRLKRNWIDLIQIHGSYYSDDDYELIMQKNGMLEELEKMKEEGLVKFIGFSIEAQNESLYKFIKSGRFDTIQICYNFIFQHPYDPSFKCGSLYDAQKQELGIISMRTTTSGIFQKWISTVNPANTFDYTKALIQFQLSNPFIDVALIGMRNADIVAQNVEICNDLSGRIDIEKLHSRYI